VAAEEKLIKSKLVLLEPATYLKNVSEACRLMGYYSRNPLYRATKGYEEGGVDDVREKSRQKPNAKKRLLEEVELEVLRFTPEDVSLGQISVSDNLRQEGARG